MSTEMLEEMAELLDSIQLREMQEKARRLNCTLEGAGSGEYRLLDKKGNALCLIKYETGPRAGKKCIALAAEIYDPEGKQDLLGISRLLAGIEQRLPLDVPDLYTYDEVSQEDECETWFTRAETGLC